MYLALISIMKVNKNMLLPAIIHHINSGTDPPSLMINVAYKYLRQFVGSYKLWCCYSSVVRQWALVSTF